VSGEIKSKIRTVPTIGILDGLPGLENSGRIIVMTDSDCMSMARQVRPCYQLFENFVQIATRSNSTSDLAELLNQKYQLPVDYRKPLEEVAYKTFEDFLQ